MALLEWCIELIEFASAYVYVVGKIKTSLEFQLMIAYHF